MNKYKILAAVVATALMSVAGAASAQAVTGGGATLPAKLYKGEADSILPSNFTYAETGSGTGKSAFLTNNPVPFGATGTVHFAGSDSVLSAAELSTYNATYNVAGDANRYGALIQVPSVGTSVTLPFANGSTALALDDEKLCGIISGRYTQWSQIEAGRSGAIKVVYRTGSSGTTELLTRFLATVCPAENAATSNLVNGTFTTTNTFINLFQANRGPKYDPATGVPTPAYTYIAAGSSQGLYDAVYLPANAGAFGYVGPDVIPVLDDATKVAKLRGFSPDEVSVQATLNTVAPPTGTAANDPLNWVPVFTNPSTGYPIAGYTNFIIGQCYKDGAVADALRTTLRKHYTNGNETAIRDHGFIPLTTAWMNAINARFIAPGNLAALNNATTCANIGRPL